MQQLPEQCSFEEICRGKSLVPYTENETRQAMQAVKQRRSKGGDLLIGHPRFAPDGPAVLEWASQGVVFMNSQIMLKSGFLFLKLNGGKSLFGRQKAVFASFLASTIDEDQWDAGPVFKLWPLATTSIGNVYRGNGFR